MPFHRPILDLRAVLIMLQTRQSYQIKHHNVAGIISIHPNKFNAMNLFTKPMKRMFKLRLIVTLVFSLVLCLIYVYENFIAAWTMLWLFSVAMLCQLYSCNNSQKKNESNCFTFPYFFTTNCLRLCFLSHKSCDCRRLNFIWNYIFHSFEICWLNWIIK